ncbi:hypothetical protein HYU08_00130 [Candidatus Woesearchaeota archaeon]|nr:hypothetical protein [Candidatus Woesearchaeota archaeon]
MDNLKSRKTLENIAYICFAIATLGGIVVVRMVITRAILRAEEYKKVK